MRMPERASWLRRPVVGAALAALVLVGGAVLADRVGWAAPAGTRSQELTGTALVRVGQQAPELALTTTGGQHDALSRWRGHAVWLAFGATWCPPCRAEAPDIQSTWERSKRRGDQVVAIYKGDDAATVTGFAQRLGLTYLQVPDPGATAADRYGVVGIPTHVFIDAAGMVRAVRVGVLTPEQAQAELDRLAAPSASPGS